MMYDQSRKIMRESGNMHQWINGYPNRNTLRKDIMQGNSYIIEHEEMVVGTFAFIEGLEPTYATIYEGNWIDSESSYGTIHRLASLKNRHGIAHECLEWCFERKHNIRIDTHRDNLIMHHILLKEGFHRCGIIYLQNGDERIAYQKC